MEILLLPGDGRGPEAVGAAKAAILAAADRVEVVEGDIGFPAYERYGDPLPYETLDQVGGSPVVVCGPTAPSGDGRDPLSRLMDQLDLFGRCRRFRTLAPGMGREGVDVTIWGTNMNASRDVAETEDVDGITISKYIRSSFYARTMSAALSDLELGGRRRATCVAWERSFPESSGMIYETFDALFGREDIDSDRMDVDLWAADFVTRPEAYGTVIVSDLYSAVAEGLAAALTGGGALSPVRYAGDSKSLILPCGTSVSDSPCSVAGVVSAAEALAELGLRDEASRVTGALRSALSAGERPEEAGGDLPPDRFVEAVVARI